MLFVPNFNCNLISVQKLTYDMNCVVTYKADFCEIQDQTLKKRIGLGELQDGVYVMKVEAKGSSLAVVEKDSTNLCHARMGHPSNQVLQYISPLLRCTLNFNKLLCCDMS